MAREENDLIELFRQLGAKEPEQWASSQIKENIPQLHRFVFLKEAWARVSHEDDDSWIDRSIEEARKKPDAPFSGQGQAIERMLASGVRRTDIVDVVRTSQAALMFDFLYMLDDPTLDAEVEELVGSPGWALVTTNDEFEPTDELIGGLHESLLETDPTGREMRPRPKA